VENNIVLLHQLGLEEKCYANIVTDTVKVMRKEATLEDISFKNPLGVLSPIKPVLGKMLNQSSLNTVNYPY
jgi:hypothetical protein